MHKMISLDALHENLKAQKLSQRHLKYQENASFIKKTEGIFYFVWDFSFFLKKKTLNE